MASFRIANILFGLALPAATVVNPTTALAKPDVSPAKGNGKCPIFYFGLGDLKGLPDPQADIQQRL